MTKNKNNTYKRGVSILGLLFWGFILILILSFFNISIRGVVESPTGQDNIGYVQENSQTVWDKYLKEPIVYLWQDVWIDIFWEGFINNMERIRDGKPTDFDEAAPQVPIRPS